VQQLHASFRGARNKEWISTLHRKPPNVQGMKAINILFNTDSIQNVLIVHMLQIIYVSG
jgi:hypothetical protein